MCWATLHGVDDLGVGRRVISIQRRRAGERRLPIHQHGRAVLYVAAERPDQAGPLLAVQSDHCIPPSREILPTQIVPSFSGSSDLTSSSSDSSGPGVGGRGLLGPYPVTVTGSG